MYNTNYIIPQFIVMFNIYIHYRLYLETQKICYMNNFDTSVDDMFIFCKRRFNKYDDMKSICL